MSQMLNRRPGRCVNSRLEVGFVARGNREKKDNDGRPREAAARPRAAWLAVGFVELRGSRRDASANVLANDTDADGALNPSSVAVVTQPTGGTVSVATN